MGYLMAYRKTKKTVIVLGIIMFVVFSSLICVVGGYVGYVVLTYYRLGNTTLEVNNNNTNKISSDDIGSKEFSISTYNIGFGAYDRDYSFFMDKSEFKQEYIESQGRKDNSGLYGKGVSEEKILQNTHGAYQLLQNYEDFDFMLYQEVDTKSTRAHNVNQLEIGNEYFTDYASVHGVNYHSAYLAYPFADPIGASNSGITTYTKYEITKANRQEFTITKDFFGKFFDLDRAFTISELPIMGSDKKLYIFNVHMSAYDKDGIVRKAQLSQLISAIKTARDVNGFNNYVVVGGDFNHDLVIDNPALSEDYMANIFDKQETDILKTDWYNYFRLNDSLHDQNVTNLITGITEKYVSDFKGQRLKAYGPTNLATARDASIPFVDANNNGIIDNAMVSIDGFLVSDNISVSSVVTLGSGTGLQEENLDENDPRYGLGFVYSDHNPVVMNFTLLN